MLIAALGTLCLSSAFVVTGALLESQPNRVAPVPHETVPVIIDRRAPLRSSDARTRATDQLPAAAASPAPVPGVAEPPVIAAAQAPAKIMVNEVAAALRRAGEGGRRIAVLGNGRDVGTTRTAIALARTLARTARVVLVDLAFDSPNVDVISTDPSAPGIADLARGAASFNDIITRDKFSRLHLVAAGHPGREGAALLESYMLLSAVDALGQSYDYLVVDAGSQSDAVIKPIAQVTTRAVLVAGNTSENSVSALREHLLACGFADVTILTGAPPSLDHAAGSSAAA